MSNQGNVVASLFYRGYTVSIGDDGVFHGVNDGGSGYSLVHSPSYSLLRNKIDNALLLMQQATKELKVVWRKSILFYGVKVNSEHHTVTARVVLAATAFGETRTSSAMGKHILPPKDRWYNYSQKLAEGVTVIPFSDQVWSKVTDLFEEVVATPKKVVRR